LTADLQAALQTRKPEIIAFLRAGEAVNTAIVPIQPKGSLLPFFGIPGHNGDVFCYVAIAQSLGNNQPFYGLQPPGFNSDGTLHDNVRDLAARYVSELVAFYPGGPYLVGGYCAGGTIAFEVAQQLVSKGHAVGLLALFESPFPHFYRPELALWNVCRYLSYRVQDHAREMARLNWRAKAEYVAERIRSQTGSLRHENGSPAPVNQVADATIRAVRAYAPTLYPGRLHLFRASEEVRRRDLARVQRWQSYAAGGFEEHIGPDGSDGSNILVEPFVGASAESLKRVLAEVNINYTKTAGDMSATRRCAC
jgi:thioesterase domain-containing protein